MARLGKHISAAITRRGKTISTDELLFHYHAVAETLDLPLNNLSGSIPPEIAQMTSLGMMTYECSFLLAFLAYCAMSYNNSLFSDWLSLSNNALVGTIPAGINGMATLSKYWCRSVAND